MILFLAHTPYQLLNSIILASTEFKNYDCDLYYAENLTAQAERLKKHKIFHETYKIKFPDDILPRNTKLSRSIVRIKNALDIKRIEKLLPVNPSSYERVLLSGVSLRNIEYYYAVKKLNKSTKLSLYEEGIYEYYLLSLKKDYMKIIFSLAFFGRYYLYDADSLFVHMPGAIGENNWSNIAVKKIPEFKNAGLLSAVNDAFSYSPTEINGKRGLVVILEQAFNDPRTKELEQMQIAMIRELSQEINLIVKLHPRSASDKYGQSVKTMASSMPFEIVMMNEDITNNIFISISSSAVINFKAIFDDEPYVIMLHKLFFGHKDNETLQLLERIQRFYRSDKFFIPDSFEEFRALLRHLTTQQIRSYN